MLREWWTVYVPYLVECFKARPHGSSHMAVHGDVSIELDSNVENVNGSKHKHCCTTDCAVQQGLMFLSRRCASKNVSFSWME